MKFIAELADQRHELILYHAANDAAQVTATIDGRRYELMVQEIASGVQFLIAGNRTYVCRSDKRDSRGEGVEIYVNGKAYPVTIIDPKRMRGGHGSDSHAGDGSAQIVAPMPGKVVRVLIEQGVRVEVGEGLIIVEAMKMQNELKSPRAGIVAALQTEAGATVNAGDVLAIIE